MNIYVKGDWFDKFEKSFRQYAELQKKDVHDLFEQQCRGIAKNLFAVTPPIGSNTAGIKLPKPGQKSRGVQIDWKRGQNAGRSAIGSDLKKAFDPQSQKRFDRLVLARKAEPHQGSYGWVKNWYNSNLTPRKRAKTSKLPVPKGLVTELKKYLWAKQGWTPAGWMAAAKRMGVTGIPGWISRHNASGSVQFQNSKPEMYFEAKNDTPHPNSKRIESQLELAVQMQANVMGRWLKDRAEKLAKGLIS